MFTQSHLPTFLFLFLVLACLVAGPAVASPEDTDSNEPAGSSFEPVMNSTAIEYSGTAGKESVDAVSELPADQKTESVTKPGDAAAQPTGTVRWGTPLDLEHSPLQAGYGLSMVRDKKTGLLHISYLEFSNSADTPGMLVYQNGTGTTWNEPVIIDDTIGFWHREVPEPVRHTSIALGQDGLPHIAYMSWNESYHLKYARMLRSGERTWTPGGNHTDSPSPSGNQVMDMTRYGGAEQVNNGWLVASCEKNNNLAGWGASLVVDSNNEPHISYLRQDGFTSPVMLMYGTYNARFLAPPGTNSSFTFVPNPIARIHSNLPLSYWQEHTRAGIGTSIALDSAGYPQISYSGDVSGAPLTRSRDSTSAGTCADAGHCRAVTGLIFTHYNHTYRYEPLAPFFFWDSSLIATNFDGLPGLWSRHTGNVLYPAAIIDAHDVVHIVSSETKQESDLSLMRQELPAYIPEFTNTTNLHYLYYTTAGPGSAQRTEIAAISADGYDMYPSIRLDTAGEPRIAFADSGDGNIRYVFRANGTWSASGPGGRGAGPAQFVNLALDGSGNPQIVYFDAGEGRLKYLTGTGVPA